MVQRDDVTSLALAERIREALHDDTDEIPVTVSVGVSVLAPEEHARRRTDPAQALRDALRAADIAMYEAKAAGGNRVVAKMLDGVAAEPHASRRQHDAKAPGSD